MMRIKTTADYERALAIWHKAREQVEAGAGERAVTVPWSPHVYTWGAIPPMPPVPPSQRERGESRREVANEIGIAAATMVPIVFLTVIAKVAFAFIAPLVLIADAVCEWRGIEGDARSAIKWGAGGVASVWLLYVVIAAFAR